MPAVQFASAELGQPTLSQRTGPHTRRRLLILHAMLFSYSLPLLESPPALRAVHHPKLKFGRAASNNGGLLYLAHERLPNSARSSGSSSVHERHFVPPPPFYLDPPPWTLDGLRFPRDPPTGGGWTLDFLRSPTDPLGGGGWTLDFSQSQIDPRNAWKPRENHL